MGYVIVVALAVFCVVDKDVDHSATAFGAAGLALGDCSVFLCMYICLSKDMKLLMVMMIELRVLKDI